MYCAIERSLSSWKMDQAQEKKTSPRGILFAGFDPKNLQGIWYTLAYVRIMAIRLSPHGKILWFSFAGLLKRYFLI